MLLKILQKIFAVPNGQLLLLSTEFLVSGNLPRCAEAALPWGSVCSQVTCVRLALEHDETINDCVIYLIFFKGVFSIPKFSEREENPLPFSGKLGQQSF